MRAVQVGGRLLLRLGWLRRIQILSWLAESFLADGALPSRRLPYRLFVVISWQSLRQGLVRRALIERGCTYMRRRLLDLTEWAGLSGFAGGAYN